MKEGSIVALEKPLSDSDMDTLHRHNIKRFPLMGEEYVVALLRKPIHHQYHDIEMCIVLEEFPEYEEMQLDVDATLFVELLPPQTIVVEELIEQPELV